MNQMPTLVKRHMRRGRPVRQHVRFASIVERGNKVIITVDRRDFDTEVKRMGAFGRKVANTELRRLGIKGVTL